VLPSGAVVDASAVAVLPFAAGDARLAEGLERDVVASLRAVPGLYVIADAAVKPYAATELDPTEIGGQLGARGIVDAAVELVDGRVLVSARLRDAATGATLWRTEVDRPVDELSAIRNEIADSIAATMLDSSLREQTRADRSSAPVSASKPIQQ
jgi:adenylate cyclase